MNIFTQSIGVCARGGLVQVGRLCSERVIHDLNAAVNYLEAGRWFHEQGLEPEFVHADKARLFQFAAKKIGDAKLLYLEFGVWKGDSIKLWTRYNANPASHFDGFDSFEGLPEVWNARAGRGAYSALGKIPGISDPRVTFHKGWFHETLPSYEAPDHDVLFANFDAALYQSTVEALEVVARSMRAGTFLYFDEFSDRLHEMRAFREFADSHHLRYSVICATPQLSQVIFQVQAIGAVGPRS